MYWKAKHQDRLPDFIIGGAMKSGTTSLHAILNSHPDIAMAHNELGFFDMDSILQHPDFNFFDKQSRTWISQSIEKHPDLIWDWYYSQFKGLRENHKLIGEDSTTYLSSRNVAKRIAIQEKKIKIIFILRHPTKRTISNYLHALKSDRAIYNLEDTLKYNPNSILRRSLYYEQLIPYYESLPFDSIKVILFEDFISDKMGCIKEVCDFLEVDFNKLDMSAISNHSNKTVIPKHIGLQLLKNRWTQKQRDYRYLKFLPKQSQETYQLPMKYRLINKIHDRINTKSDQNTYIINESTIQLLDAFFKSELSSIDSLTQKNIFAKWFNK